MKKFFNLILTFLLVVSVLPVDALAVDNSDAERIEILNKACIAFPEYAAKILEQDGAPVNIARSTVQPELIACISRNLSDTEVITLTEYSDGAILLSNADTHFKEEIIYVGHTTHSAGTQYTVNIKATYVYGTGVFTLSNVKYAIFNNQYDSIVSTGSVSTTGGCNYNSSSTVVWSETASDPACIQYILGFPQGDYPKNTYTSRLTFTVQNNVASVTHVGIDYHE